MSLTVTPATLLAWHRDILKDGRLDFAYHVAVAYKQARPHWGRGWKLMAEVAVWLNEDLNDLAMFVGASRPAGGADAEASSSIQTLAMAMVYRDMDAKPTDRWAATITNGWYFWIALDPRRRSKKAAREQIEAARAEIKLRTGPRGGFR